MTMNPNNNPPLTLLGALGGAGNSSTSLDLPPALASILNVGVTANPTGNGMPTGGTFHPAMTGLSSGVNAPSTFVPSYEAGGMIGADGMPEPMGGMPPQGMNAGTTVGLSPQQPSGGMSPQMLEMQVNQFATQHPQQVAQIRQAIMEVIQTGELTMQELNMIVQLATVAAQNPEMYPYVRKFAIQQGIATEQDLPAEYDQGLVIVMLVAAKAIQQDQGGAGMGMGMPEMGGGQPIPSMARGGMTPDSRKSDGSVLINAHEGEYVVPAHVVKMKGKEFFDSLVEKYRDNK
jgi:hypothetical protein